MKTTPSSCTHVIWLFLLAMRLHAAPPPNDMYTNATILVGSSISFTGTLAEATVENAEVFLNGANGWLDRSVWWKWTAPDASPVTLYVSGVSMAAPDGSGIGIWDFKRSFTNFEELWDSGPFGLPTTIGLSWAKLFPYTTFIPISGETYSIQLRCTPEATFNLVLISTNTPVIMEQPRTQSVSENGYPLFTVLAGGLKPLGYQWQFEGADLPGQTTPMLALTNVTSSQAGNYSVVVTNAGGATTSQVARLIIEPDVPPAISVLSSLSNRIELLLNAQEGRPYRIESSTNLLDWSAEQGFSPRIWPIARGNLPLTSVILTTNTITHFTITNTTQTKFVRTVRYAPANELCNWNLKRIRFAKEAWCRDGPCNEWNAPSGTELLPFYAEWPAVFWPIPNCPVGGIYSVNSSSWLPTCTNSGHILEEPR